MKILLPPSETKREGGDGSPLDVSALALPDLAPQRNAVIDALIALADDEDSARRVLKLSERQRGDVAHNRALRSAPTMPAVDRYTGVLFDAPFGPVAALDAIPTYRLAAGTALPGVAPLRRHWADPTTTAIAADAPAFVLDLRSEAYAALGPVPGAVSSAYVRVVTEQGRALNHFNKKSKGLLVRALAEDRPRLGSLRALQRWAQAHDVVLRDGKVPGEVELVVAD